MQAIGSTKRAFRVNTDIIVEARPDREVSSLQGDKAARPQGVVSFARRHYGTVLRIGARGAMRLLGVPLAAVSDVAAPQ